jgi:hypothetical protein
VLDLNYAVIVVAAVAVFAFAAVYYSVMATEGAKLSAAWAEAGASRPPFWEIGLELAKGLVIAAVVAGLVSQLGIQDLAGAIALALVLWITFPVLLLVGSVTHEKVPWRLAAIHAGDWLAKLLLIALIVAIWR